MERFHEIRDPIHGFIEVLDWERDIINHPVFQRLRRIKQLAFTDFVYPSASHTRFAHSLGVMHIATKMYDTISEKFENELEDHLRIREDGRKRHRYIIRLAALLHDVGHPPFSHSSEQFFPKNDDDDHFSHEDYSAEIIKTLMTDVIDDHPYNQTNSQIKASEVADFISKKPINAASSFWQKILDSHLDADKMDYLLRDSEFCGVQYGKFDLARILNTLCVIDRTDQHGEIDIGIQEGGLYAAEELILARYFMFAQVYFHKVRRAYDYHLHETLEKYLRNTNTFPSPNNKRSLKKYLDLDDHKIYEFIKKKSSARGPQQIFSRNHDRVVHETGEISDISDIEKTIKEFNEKSEKLSSNGIANWADDPAKSMYSLKNTEIYIQPRNRSTLPLSKASAILGNLKSFETRKQRLYVSHEESDKAIKILYP